MHLIVKRGEIHPSSDIDEFVDAANAVIVQTCSPGNPYQSKRCPDFTTKNGDSVTPFAGASPPERYSRSKKSWVIEFEAAVHAASAVKVLDASPLPEPVSKIGTQVAVSRREEYVRYLCKYCGSSYLTKRVLRRHMETRHKKQTSGKTSKSTPSAAKALQTDLENDIVDAEANEHRNLGWGPSTPSISPNPKSSTKPNTETTKAHLKMITQDIDCSSSTTKSMVSQCTLPPSLNNSNPEVLIKQTFACNECSFTTTLRIKFKQHEKKVHFSALDAVNEAQSAPLVVESDLTESANDAELKNSDIEECFENGADNLQNESTFEPAVKRSKSTISTYCPSVIVWPVFTLYEDDDNELLVNNITNAPSSPAMSKIREVSVLREKIHLENNTTAIHHDLPFPIPSVSVALEAETAEYVDKVLHPSTVEGTLVITDSTTTLLKSPDYQTSIHSPSKNRDLNPPAGRDISNPGERGGINLPHRNTLNYSSESESDSGDNYAFIGTLDYSSDEDRLSVKPEPMDNEERDEEPPDEDDDHPSIVVIKQEMDESLHSNKTVIVSGLRKGQDGSGLVNCVPDTDQGRTSSFPHPPHQTDTETVPLVEMLTCGLPSGEHKCRTNEVILPNTVSTLLTENAMLEDEIFRDIRFNLAHDESEPDVVLDPQTGFLVRNKDPDSQGASLLPTNKSANATSITNVSGLDDQTSPPKLIVALQPIPNPIPLTKQRSQRSLHTSLSSPPMEVERLQKAVGRTRQNTRDKGRQEDTKIKRTIMELFHKPRTVDPKAVTALQNMTETSVARSDTLSFSPTARPVKSSLLLGTKAHQSTTDQGKGKRTKKCKRKLSFCYDWEDSGDESNEESTIKTHRRKSKRKRKSAVYDGCVDSDKTIKKIIVKEMKKRHLMLSTDSKEVPENSKIQQN